MRPNAYCALAVLLGMVVVTAVTPPLSATIPSFVRYGITAMFVWQSWALTSSGRRENQ
jgi:hypothetical protein